MHALRYVSNKRDPKATLAQSHGLANFDSLEEFFAVLVTNIYASELKGTLRSSHHGQLVLDKEWAGSFEFFKISAQAYEKVKRVCTENAGLTRALADVKVPFNPIAAYYIAPAKAKELSHTAGFASDLGPFGLIGPGLSLPEWRDLMAQ